MPCCSDKAEILEANVGAEGASHDHAEQDHDLLPPRLALVLERLLGVVGGARRVLHRALHMRVNPARKKVQVIRWSDVLKQCPIAPS